LLAAGVIAAAACTDPTFADPDEGGATTRSDAEVAATAGADSSISSSNEAGDSPRDASVPDPDKDADDHTPASDAGSSAPDANVPAAEAGNARDAGNDSMVVTPVDPVPGWAKPLLGRYAKRSVIYAYDDSVPTVTLTIEDSLVQITADADGALKLRSQLCSYVVGWRSGAALLTLDKPESIAPIEMHITLGSAPHFSTDTAMQQMGYDPSRQSRCTSGASRAMKFEDQKWLTSTCACTSTPQVLPTDAMDCRLTDTDGDMRGGVLFRGEGFAINGSVVVNASVKITDGEVRADHEHLITEQHTRNGYCLTPACGDIGNEVLCPQRYATLRQLQKADATCADARTAVNDIAVQTIPDGDCRAK
jgi:hypothetical protein